MLLLALFAAAALPADPPVRVEARAVATIVAGVTIRAAAPAGRTVSVALKPQLRPCNADDRSDPCRMIVYDLP